MVVFYRILDLSRINAYILYNQHQAKNRMRRLSEEFGAIPSISSYAKTRCHFKTIQRIENDFDPWSGY